MNLNAENFCGDVVAVLVDDNADGDNDDESYNTNDQSEELIVKYL